MVCADSSTQGAIGLGSLPLKGILVADFSRVLAGPTTTVTLSDLGASVIKVERPDGGDETRAWGPPWSASSSSYFAAANRSKLSVTMDLMSPEDLELARELARRADVLVENFRTGALEKFGLGFADVERVNPRVVYCSITGYGSGAGASMPGYDFVVQAIGGLMSITGDVEGEPRKAGVALVDILTAKDAAIGILAALQTRNITGRGQHVEVNLLSSLLGSLANQASGYLATGNSPKRMGNAHPSIAPYETLRCRNGLLAVACGNDGQFKRLVETIGLDGVATDPRFVTNEVRVANREALVAALETELTRADAEDWERKLMAADVPAGRVGDIGSAFERAEALGLTPTVDMGPNEPSQVRHSIQYSAMTPQNPGLPPTLGAHDTLVREWLRDDCSTISTLISTIREAGSDHDVF